MTTFNLNIDMDKRCPQCQKTGAIIRDDESAAPCLSCALKNLKAGKYDHLFKKNEERK